MNVGIAITLSVLALLSGCKSQEPLSGKSEDKVEVTALVTAVDASNRTVTLKGEKGRSLVVEAGPDVDNLDKVRVGDTVAVTYTTAVSWTVRPAGSGSPGITTQASADRASATQKPAMSVGDSVTVTASITRIDKDKGTVDLTGPAGNTIVLEPKDASILEKVKVADLVDLTYSEGLAAAVRPTTTKSK